MGEVYRTQDTKLGRDVAIKILPYEFARDPERLSRLHREARTLAWIEKGSPTRSFFVLSWRRHGGRVCVGCWGRYLWWELLRRTHPNLLEGGPERSPFVVEDRE
jgi:serine/threonine protein kinase